jgi:beta-glucosidase-like glycosyl hydrolase
MVGQVMKESRRNTLSAIKHYALNDRESGATPSTSTLLKRSMRKRSAGLEIDCASPMPAVMCSYNRLNGDYGKNKYLLTDVERRLKAGFVVSDWQATHSAAEGVRRRIEFARNPVKSYGTP